MMKTKTGLYIHIPFCQSKCYYCDFNSQIPNWELEEAYFEALVREVRLSADTYKNRIIDSIFIGGGTPSIVNSQFISRILSEVYKNFSLVKDCEISIEANPKSLDIYKLRAYKTSGINRISLGAQSFVDRELLLLGRIHRAEDILNTVTQIKKAGFENFNLDLMMGIPDQTLESFLFSLEQALKLEPKHLSVYSLIIEEGTRFFDLYQNKKLNLVDEDEEREIYYSLKELLRIGGFKHYEISNFAKENFESKHNLKYWTNQDYLGLGLGSHYKLGAKRFENQSKIENYIEDLSKFKLPLKKVERLSRTDQINEIIFMGLRISDGFDYGEIERNFNIDFRLDYSDAIEKNLESGYIKIKNKRISLTEKGLDFSNLVELDFYRLDKEG